MKTDKVQRIFPTSLSKLGSTSLFHPETRKNPLQGTGQRGIPERRRAVPSSRSTSCESAVRGPAQGPPLPFPADRQARMRLHCHLRLQRGGGPDVLVSPGGGVASRSESIRLAPTLFLPSGPAGGGGSCTDQHPLLTLQLR